MSARVTAKQWGGLGEHVPQLIGHLIPAGLMDDAFVSPGCPVGEGKMRVMASASAMGTTGAPFGL